MDERGILEAVMRATRELASQRVRIRVEVAARLGLSPSDIETIEVLLEGGAKTAGQLAEASGLSTGAVTRMIDRLEQAGFVRRVADASDRRRVIVELVPERLRAIGPMFDAVARATREELASVSESDLRVVSDVLRRVATAAAQSATDAASAYDAATDGTSGDQQLADLFAPLGGATNGRLLFRAGTPELTLGAGDDDSMLYRAHFAGPPPQVRARDGVVTVHYRRGLFDWRSRRADVRLNRTIPWRVDLQGGVHSLTADFRGVTLRGLDVLGGAGRSEIRLDRPSGLVPVRIIGGASDVAVRRPRGVPVTVRVAGGLSRLDLDGSRHGPMGGSVRLASPNADAAADRFAIEIVGGASRVSVSEAD
jgi:DNA-binding MarR family transcriptional regulator